VSAQTGKTLGIIGGTAIYELEGLADVKETVVETPFGTPSDVYVQGTLGDVRLIFLARHGRGHRILPHEINYRANIYGMKALGADGVVALSAVGSMREDIRPGDMVVVDQFFDRTRMRPSTFFGQGLAGHVAFADPVCAQLSALAHRAAVAQGGTVHRTGTYLCIEGPQFSTRAESRAYRAWGADVIGMTNLPEARLAREAELCFCTVALATDYDCWHETEEDVDVTAVLEVLKANARRANALVAELCRLLPEAGPCECSSALSNALLTARDKIPEETLKRLDLLVGKYLK
jgi:5'-methylthioadenosine phosphorylase